ncbi:MAG: DUF2723 domain-containing protein [Bacteroidetes bacterium]|uniref:DUF2723 domain-containing protein n=1 Tax=Phaeocystidibacter marisrubri TaxID=1577780 RepID=A0A6L3ZD65_9FLAO|nr:DUF2723 domain-containing protein [Phaeocystidibacter marisrubri]KAB2815155.1 DUF2723 domain-containing protein [Phaeocystidibacter marisrubri]TNE27399.1 MAG: DUF2723 domain-containing protein [Bacteroidota bacterium]GGH70611.1 membrane protein [Phaeocystidibacter marisrubri]
MQISNYSKINNILGWLIWAIATYTYVATVAPTTSFWDCGEYIATSVKLQVGHPPGAPLFQLVGNFFAQFASDPTGQAYMVNLLSALSSSFSILFLFWTISHLAKKLLTLNGAEFNAEKMLLVFGAATVGALAFTWSDTFWYSAVEGEVYAMSSFLTAVAFWAVTKWERAFDNGDTYANRWLVLIAYLIGLSVGVHILTFLAIPPIVLVVYYKYKPNASYMSTAIGTIMSVIILGVVFKVIIPFVLKLLGFLEITFVNDIGLMKNSGTIVAILLIGAIAYFGVHWFAVFTQKVGHYFASNWDFETVKTNVRQGIIGVLFILVGYSSFVMLGVRSNANTPIDENNPEDALSMLAYYNREQYGDWPVMYGQVFNAQLDQDRPFLDGSKVYVFDEEEGEYVVANDNKASVANYAAEWKVFFPRMWSDQANHVQNYINLSPGIRSEKDKPTFADNVKFFMDYQVGHMYWRYFLWNFVGRQNDIQHHYEPQNGNFVTGIGGIDEGLFGRGDMSLMPDYLKNNKAHNVYFALPFLLGLIGLVYQAMKDGKDAWVITMFFLFTGLAIVVYTNHKPFEPRERDYAFVGSFYVFAIWIGLGVVGLYEILKKYAKVPGLAGITTVVCLIIPGIMAAENWDDHDRSERYMARDTAKAYLDSCEKNAILFTNGDNDTFPLWYIQEVEGYRTDVRVVNLSLLNTDWYIDQLKRAAYDGAPVPFTYTWDQYKMGTRDVLYFNPQRFQQEMRMNPGSRWTTDQFVEWTKNEGDQFKFKYYENTLSPKEFYYYPQKKLRINIDKEQVLAQGVVPVEDSAKIVDYIDWNLGGNALLKRDMMLIDLINENDWTRPIYFAITVGSSPKSFFWLQDYFRLEGLAYRFVPIKSEGGQGIEYGYVDTDLLYDRVMAWEFEGMNDPDVYLDETCRRPTYNLRTIYARLARSLHTEGQTEKAIEVLDRCMELTPVEKFEYNYFITGIIEAYYLTGATDKANELLDGYIAQLDQEFKYYNSMSNRRNGFLIKEASSSSQMYDALAQIAFQFKHSGNQTAAAQDPLFQKAEQYRRQWRGSAR